MKNFLRYPGANAALTIAVSNTDYENKDISQWKVDLVQTEIELISKNPGIDGLHKQILEWVITPPDYDETIDNRLTVAVKGIVRYRSAKIVSERIIAPSDEHPLVFDDLDMVKDENDVYVPVMPENPEYVWYQRISKTTTCDGQKITVYDNELSFTRQ